MIYTVCKQVEIQCPVILVQWYELQEGGQHSQTQLNANTILETLGVFWVLTQLNTIIRNQTQHNSGKHGASLRPIAICVLLYCPPPTT